MEEAERKLGNLATRVGEVEKDMAGMKATLQAHGIELRDVKTHLDKMDQETIKPMYAKIDTVHTYVTRLDGMEKGRQDMRNRFWKAIGALVAIGGLILAVLKLLIQT